MGASVPFKAKSHRPIGKHPCSSAIPFRCAFSTDRRTFPVLIALCLSSLINSFRLYLQKFCRFCESDCFLINTIRTVFYILPYIPQKINPVCPFFLQNYKASKFKAQFVHFVIIFSPRILLPVSVSPVFPKASGLPPLPRGRRLTYRAIRPHRYPAPRLPAPGSR